MEAETRMGLGGSTLGVVYFIHSQGSARRIVPALGLRVSLVVYQLTLESLTLESLLVDQLLGGLWAAP